MKYGLLYFIILLSFNNLPELIEEMNNSLTVIETEKETIAQIWSYEDAKPFDVTFKRTTSEIEGDKEETEKYVFNLALLDKNRVEIKSSKKEIKVVAESSLGKFIRRYEDGESKGYVDDIEILCEDIDAARDFEEILKQAIEEAQAVWEASIQLPSDLPSLTGWLVSYVADVEGEKDGYQQKMIGHQEFQDFLIIGSKEKDKESNTITFSLADLEAKTIKVESVKDLIKVELKTTQGKKYIQVENEKDGLSFDKDFKVYFSDASAALAWAKGVEEAVELANSVAEARRSGYESAGNALEVLSQLVTAYADEDWHTELNPDCQAVLVYTAIDKEEKTSYEYAWADLESGSMEVDFNSSELKMTLRTKDKKKFVTVRENGEIDDYENEIEILFNEVESLYQAKGAVKQILESCDLTLEVQDIPWLTQTMEAAGPLDEMRQSLSTAEDNCSIVYQSSEVDGDKEETYEMNLYDLNPNEIEMDISGKKLELELVTNNKEKIITLTDEKGKTEYTGKVTLLFPSLEELRTAALTIKALIEGCGE